MQIDIDARMIGIRYPMEANLVGDSAQTLGALIPLLTRQEDRAWREIVESNVSEWRDVLEARAMNPGDPINPQRVFWELSSRLPDNCILSADSGWRLHAAAFNGMPEPVFHLTARAMGIITGLAAIEPDPRAPKNDLLLDAALQAAAGLQQLLQFCGDCVDATSGAEQEAATARLVNAVPSWRRLPRPSAGCWSWPR